jgi:hypothetical protein
MTIHDMIPGHRYLAGDSYGYDHVWCEGTPKKHEILSHFGMLTPGGFYVKVRYEKTGESDIWFEANGYEGTGCTYVEPA